MVIAQAACEVRTEQAIRVLLEKKGLVGLSDPLLKLFTTSKNICNDRLRDIYNALSNSQIQNEHFWQRLKNHYDRRNAIVRKGASCNDAGARASLDAVEEYFTYLNKVFQKLG